MSIEEIGLACSLAGFVVIAPADEISTKALVHAAAAHDGPVFIRTGRPKAPVIYSADQKFEIGKAIEVVEGTGHHAHRQRTAGAAIHPAPRKRSKAKASPRASSTCTPSSRSTAKPSPARPPRPAPSWSPKSTWWMAASACAWPRWSPRPTPASWSSWAFTIATPNPGKPDELLEKYGLVAPDIAAAVRKAAEPQ